MVSKSGIEMVLNAKSVEHAKPRAGVKLTKLSDGGGLYLLVTATGSKLWRLNYRYGGKQKTLALGSYPAVSLADARERRDRQKEILANRRDPSVERKVSADNTFGALADAYLAKMAADDRADASIEKNRWLLAFARPSLGARPIAEITSGDVLAVLRGIEAGGRRESARRARAIIGGVFRLAIAESKATQDPTAALRGMLKAPNVQHRAALLEAADFGGLLRAIDGMDTPLTRAALKLCSLLAPRPGELRLARWEEFDLDKAVWTVPPGRMKMRREHASPLSRQVIEILGALREITGQGELLFPSERSRDRPMSDGTLNAALRRLGYGKADASAHGFRATFSSFANESGKWHSDAIERQLSHTDEDAVRGAYARSPFWAERVKLMQWWSNECDRMRDGGEVVPFRREA